MGYLTKWSALLDHESHIFSSLSAWTLLVCRSGSSTMQQLTGPFLVDTHWAESLVVLLECGWAFQVHLKPAMVDLRKVALPLNVGLKKLLTEHVFFCWCPIMSM